MSEFQRDKFPNFRIARRIDPRSRNNLARIIQDLPRIARLGKAQLEIDPRLISIDIVLKAEIAALRQVFHHLRSSHLEFNARDIDSENTESTYNSDRKYGVGPTRIFRFDKDHRMIGLPITTGQDELAVNRQEAGGLISDIAGVKIPFPPIQHYVCLALIGMENNPVYNRAIDIIEGKRPSEIDAYDVRVINT